MQTIIGWECTQALENLDYRAIPTPGSEVRGEWWRQCLPDSVRAEAVEMKPWGRSCIHITAITDHCV